ncbi:uncharacterized protein PSFLO_04378 [Pseudozyma flocculosa]|uniref:Transcription factor domain-containing protein n=1 Tax=Pseudozyma flocculosa TaxID=84751 RepID=A0A5C3F641_9BASI|nr:uncharacterized protein PSFLO_04378 [Pseudozyma flocculosa]
MAQSDPLDAYGFLQGLRWSPPAYTHPTGDDRDAFLASLYASPWARTFTVLASSSPPVLELFTSIGLCLGGQDTLPLFARSTYGVAAMSHATASTSTFASAAEMRSRQLYDHARSSVYSLLGPGRRGQLALRQRCTIVSVAVLALLFDEIDRGVADDNLTLWRAATGLALDSDEAEDPNGSDGQTDAAERDCWQVLCRIVLWKEVLYRATRADGLEASLKPLFAKVRAWDRQDASGVPASCQRSGLTDMTPWSTDLLEILEDARLGRERRHMMARLRICRPPAPSRRLCHHDSDETPRSAALRRLLFDVVRLTVQQLVQGHQPPHSDVDFACLALGLEGFRLATTLQPLDLLNPSLDSQSIKVRTADFVEKPHHYFHLHLALPFFVAASLNGPRRR